MAGKTRPRIGIPCRFDWKTSYYNLRESYPDAIFAAGGTPVLVPLIPHPDYIESVTENLDGICLSGSDSDVDPLRYGQEPRPTVGPVIPRRDETDFMLLAAAETRRIPVLGICFGIQSINVYRGGTLIQDIPSEVKDPIKHNQGDAQYRHSHSIHLSEGSVLAKLAGGTTATVNSHHHQAVDIVGRDLEPIAWSGDGVVEAVASVRPDHFMLGVQWHPEMGWENDPLSRALFGHFIAAALERLEARELVR